MAAKADKAAAKAMEKSEKAATKAKAREEKEKSKRDAKEGKRKCKVAVDAAGEPACKVIPKAKRQKKDKATSGDREVITALYNDRLAAATAASVAAAAAVSDGDKVNSEASGGRGRKEVGKGNAPDAITAISEAVGMDVDQAEKKKPKAIKVREPAASDREGLPSM